MVKKAFVFVGLTTVNGIFFIAPFAIFLIIIEKIHKLVIVESILPLAEEIHAKFHIKPLMPFIKEPIFFTLLIILFICFIVGLLAKTPRASKIIESLENSVLSLMPGYSLKKLLLKKL